MRPSLLVTGDVVLDCHLYGGVKTAATSFREPGTVYDQHVGGAALTCRLLHASADAAGAEWDGKKARWDATNKGRQDQQKPPLPRPEDLDEERPSPEFDVHLAFETEGLQKSLPQHLRSYGVWTERPMRRGAKERVWRVERHFGYGPTEAMTFDEVFKPTSSPGADPPVLTLLDDGGILFRHETARKAWPDFAAGARGFYLLKMSWPLRGGDLWSALEPVMDRLIVIVSVADLRREDIRIAQRLSWERCVENTLSALASDPTAGELLRARHVIVNFRSAGALWIRRSPPEDHSAQLLFDPVRIEGDFALDFDGTTYGFQTCLAAGVAHHLMTRHAQSVRDGEDAPRPSPFADDSVFDEALRHGIAAGLTARRRLLELGHGPVGQASPGFPVREIGQTLASSPGGYVWVPVPEHAWDKTPRQWTIIGHSERASESAASSLTGLALLTARYGRSALSHVPALRMGRLFTVDRSEIESLRAMDAIMRSYEANKVQKKPLCIGVFGPPGAGKSFGVKALSEAIFGDKVPFLEFNLSQFKNPEELIGAFHRVRDAVLRGVTPVAFWDEFDSQHYKWLQYLLAPMQDGGFQEGQVTHPIGKCIFVFAGGTSPTLQAFGLAEPGTPSPEYLGRLEPEDRATFKQELREQHASYREFKLLKGPDFVSRLDGFLNVLGPNRQANGASPDITWPIRRALMLRSLLGLEDEELDVDQGLLYALLAVPTYRHGVRSFEKIVRAIAQNRDNGRLHRTGLPPDASLDRDTDAMEFRRLMEQRNAFK